MVHTTGMGNVQIMNQTKLGLMNQETECIKITILGVSEQKWTSTGQFQSDNYKMFYSGNH